MASIERGLLTIRSDRSGGTHSVRLSGELDLESSPALEEELRRVEDTDAERIVLDLGALDFIDSSGLRILVRAKHRGAGDAERLELQGAKGQVARVLRITGLRDELPFRE